MLESHQYIFVLGDQFVKARSSFPPGTVSLAKLETIVKTLLAAVTTADEPPPDRE